MKRIRKIKFPGYLKRDYYCSLHTFLCIQIIICKLWLIRQFRRLKVALIDCKYTLIVVLLWAVFGLFVCFWGNCIGKIYSFTDFLWENKASFFTSVLITAFISVTSGFEKRHKNLIQQHIMYCKLMHDFSNFTKEAFKILTQKDDYKMVPHWPFYDENAFSLMRSELNAHSCFDLTSEAICNLHTSLKNLQSSLFLIMTSWLNVITVDYSVRNELYDLFDFLDGFDRAISANKNNKTLHNTFGQCFSKMYETLTIIRQPWRADIKYRTLFLKLLYSDDNTMNLSYYDEALLNIVDYEDYRHSMDRDYILRDLFECSKNDENVHVKEPMCTVKIPLDKYMRIMNNSENK